MRVDEHQEHEQQVIRGVAAPQVLRKRACAACACAFSWFTRGSWCMDVPRVPLDGNMMHLHWPPPELPCVSRRA